MSDVRSQFETLVAQLVTFFAAEPAAVSVNTDDFGTLTRADVARLSATMARQGAARAEIQARMAAPKPARETREMGVDFEHAGWVD